MSAVNLIQLQTEILGFRIVQGFNVTAGNFGIARIPKTGLVLTESVTLSISDLQVFLFICRT